MKKILHFLILMMALGGALSTRAASPTPDFKEGELYYKIVDADANEVQIACPGRFGGASWTYYSFESIELPTSVTHDGVTYTVTGICESGISGNKNLKSITIPDGYILGESSFYNCTALTTVVLPDDVVIKVSSPNGYSSGAQFQDCSSLTTINIPDGWTEIPGYFFNGCKALTSVSIPDGVETIGYAAFQGSGLTSLSLPTSVKEICQGAFEKCTGLTGDLNLHEGITTIGKDAFADCTSLTGISVPASLTSMGMGVFDGCTKVSSITMADGLKEIGEHMFADCDLVTTVTIPSSVEKIGKYAFYGLGKLTEIVWPENCKITEIPEACFRACSSIGGINIPTSVTKLGWQAYYQTYISDVTIPGHILEVVKSTYDSSNFGATNSVTVEYGETPLAIGTNEFNCKHLIIDRDITEKTDFQFNNLTTLTIGEHVTSLPDFNCKLTGLKTKAGAQINILTATPPAIPETAFDDTYYSAVKVTVPAEAYAAYAAHEVWGKFLSLGVTNARWDEVLSVVGEGSSSAVIEVSWGDGMGIDNLVSGVNFNGSTVADAVKAALAGDPRFYGMQIGTDFVAFGFDTNGDRTSAIVLNGVQQTLTDGVLTVNGDYTGAASNSAYDHWQVNNTASAWQVYVDGVAASWDTPITSGADIALVYTARGTSAKPEPEYTFYLRPADETGVWVPDSWSVYAQAGQAVPLLANWGADGTCTSYTFRYTDAEGNTSSIISLSATNVSRGNVIATVSRATGSGTVYAEARGYINKKYTEYSSPCELTVEIEKPVTDISIEGVEDGATIEIDQMGTFIITPVYEPSDADIQSYTVTFSDEKLLSLYSSVNAVVTHGVGSATMTITSGDGNASKTYNVVVKDYDTEVPEDNYQEGVFFLNEEWFGHTSGSINYINADREILYRAYGAQNNGMAFGATSCFGTIYADKLIVMSKQAWDGGDTREIEDNGGRVVIADAKTMKRIASFNEIGGDGRAAVGVSPDKVYLTHSKGIRVLDLSTMTLADSDIANAPVAQTGDIVTSGNYAFAVSQSKGIVVIDTTDDTFVKTIENTGVQGVVVTADGNVWYASTASGTTTLHCIDPETLEDVKQVTLPSGSAINCNWESWRPTCFFSNPNKNEILWNPGSAWGFTAKLYRWDIDEVEDPSSLEPVYTYANKADGETDTGSMAYGAAGYDPRNDEYIFATISGYGINGLYNWLHFVDASTGEVKETKKLQEYWWFPGMPIIPDQYDAELDLDNQVFSPEDTEARTFNVAELVSDRDNIDKFITYALVDGFDTSVANAGLTDGVLTIIPVAPGETTVTIALTSNGRTVNREVAVTVEKPVADAPVFSIEPGEVLKGTTVSISCAIEGAVIYYTLDETEPTAGSIEYTEPIVIDKDMTIKAVAVADGYTDSETSTATYALKTLDVPEKLYIVGHIDGSNFNPWQAVEMTKDGKTFSYIGDLEAASDYVGEGFFSFAETRGSWDDIYGGTYYGAATADEALEPKVATVMAICSANYYVLAPGRYEFKVEFLDYEVTLTVTEVIPEGIEGINADDDDSEAEYYNIQGIRIQNPAPGNVYIVRRGNTVTKEYVK